MTATVTAPNGERFEGVTGVLLDYYRSEAQRVDGYVIEETAASSVSLPVMFSAPTPPAKNAHADEWEAFACSVDPDLTPESAAEMTKKELIAKYGDGDVMVEQPVPADTVEAEPTIDETQDSTSPES